MIARILARENLEPLVDALIAQGDAIGPRDELGYGLLASAGDMVWTADGPRRSIKQFFFPQREVLFGYRTDGQEVTLLEGADEEPARVVLARPCDAAALPILDKVFAWDYVDTGYMARRRRTTVITVACTEPGDGCFCVAVGGSPAGTDGSDLLLTLLDDVYHAQAITERGEALVARHAAFFGPSDPQRDRQRARIEDKARAALADTPDLQDLAERLAFDGAAWEDIAQQCIDCGTCTFLCPTCHCFDIQDEGGPEGGERVRLWDSCATRLFTRTAVHQPRPTHASRYRQRIMHKFQYYPQNFGRILCVGCGRCVRSCPVGIDIRTVLEQVRG